MAHLFDSLYALTLGKKWVVAFFSVITLTQLVMGVYMVGLAASEPGARRIARLPSVTTIYRPSVRNTVNTLPNPSHVLIYQVSPVRDGIHVAVPILR